MDFAVCIAGLLEAIQIHLLATWPKALGRLQNSHSMAMSPPLKLVPSMACGASVFLRIFSHGPGNYYSTWTAATLEECFDICSWKQDMPLKLWRVLKGHVGTSSGMLANRQDCTGVEHSVQHAYCEAEI